MAAAQKKKLVMFLFRNFEKMICALVVLAFAGAVVQAVRINRDDELEQTIDEIERHVRVLQTPDDPPPLDELPDYAAKRERHLQVSRPPDPRGSVFWMPAPQYYPEITVGTEREFVVEFNDPIQDGMVNVSIVTGENVLDEEKMFVHPVHGDYSRVAIYTGPGEGRARITGIGGGRAHVREIITDVSIQPQPAPPVGLGHAVERRAVKIFFEPNPENRGEVAVEGYEIFRRAAHDLTGEFVRVTTVASDEEKENEGLAYTWSDRNFAPDVIYLYKIRALGERSSPKESVFAELNDPVRTMPMVDFRLVRGFMSPGGVFEIRLQLAAEVRGSFEERELELFAGDRIAAGAEGRLDSGCILLDYHREPLRHLRRIVYMDRTGRIKYRSKDLWGTGRDRGLPWDLPPAEEDEDQDTYDDLPPELQDPLRYRP